MSNKRHDVLFLLETFVCSPQVSDSRMSHWGAKALHRLPNRASIRSLAVQIAPQQSHYCLLQGVQDSGSSFYRLAFLH